MANLLLKRIKDWATSITAFRTGDVIPVDGPSGTAKMEKANLLKETAQNALAGNVAPEFDPTKPNDAGGYAYYVGEIVAYKGATYRFKTNHSSGAWNASEVERIVAGESLKFFVVTDNPEYLYAVTDKDGIFLFGIKKDGSVDWQKGLPSDIKKELNQKVNTEVGKSLVNSIFADGVSVLPNDEFIHIVVDFLERLLLSVTTDGGFHFYTPVEFLRGVKWRDSDISDLSKLLKEKSTLGVYDWSNAKKLQIAKPSCAVVNFTNILNMPVTKTQNIHGVMQFWDMCGNFFEKNVIMNAQGNSSLGHPKKNIAIDLCNDDWEGDDTFKLRFGDWVEQDSFHLKAYYTDYFRCRGAVGYDIFNDIQKTRGIQHDVPWKEALIDQSKVGYGQGLLFSSIDKTNLQLDTGARNHPLGFPVIVFLNGSFYGIFAWQLKKHRDNYHQKKDVLTHIHLDGELGADDFFSGDIDWTAFEVRNPKGLKDVNGNKYDGDNPTELSDTDPSSSFVKEKIVALADEASVLDGLVSQYGITSDQFKSEFERVFDVDNLIDYIIFMDVLGNTDAFKKNWQWTTYDGDKWYANVYDLDCSFGSEPTGTFLNSPFTSHVRSTHKLPTSYILESSDYTERLKLRYAELRQGVITPESIIDKFIAWLGNVGEKNFEEEYSSGHWINSPCNRDAEVDAHWELVRDTQGNPVMGPSNTYSSSTAYVEGDEVFYGYTSMGYYKFVCVSNVTNVAPVSHRYFKDNVYSLFQWIKKEIENMDIVYNFNN